MKGRKLHDIGNVASVILATCHALVQVTKLRAAILHKPERLLDKAFG